MSESDDTFWKHKGGYNPKCPFIPNANPTEHGIDEDGGRIGSCKVRFNVERPEWPKHWFKEEK